MRAHSLPIATIAVRFPPRRQRSNVWVMRCVIAFLAFAPFPAFTQSIGTKVQPPFSASRSLLILDRSELERAKRNARGGGPGARLALKRLQVEADRAQLREAHSVTHKTLLPPGGSKHDYMSVAPYWWPNPATASGLPYIRRDGAVNPERDQTSDRKRLDNLIQSVRTLSIAYFFTDDDKYARRGAELLRIWFLNDATKMNPRLDYAQAVPGRSHGRGAGIIETHDFPDLLDPVVLLSNSPAWTETDHKQLQGWFGSYLHWLLESPQGRAAAQARNNHGSWYDVQIASYALFTGQSELGKNVLGEFGVKRIAAQIETDGRQPHELARARAWHYSIFNLEALFRAGEMAEKIGIDLWNFEANNRSMRRALDWLIPFAIGDKKWPYKESSALEAHKLGPRLRIAALRYREPVYEQTLSKLSKITGDERWQLLYPKIPEPK